MFANLKALDDLFKDIKRLQISALQPEHWNNPLKIFEEACQYQ